MTPADFLCSLVYSENLANIHSCFILQLLAPVVFFLGNVCTTMHILLRLQALMLENLQRTSTAHVGLQPNSQVSPPEDSPCCLLFHIDKLVEYYILNGEHKIGWYVLKPRIHCCFVAHSLFLYWKSVRTNTGWLKTIFCMPCSCYSIYFLVF